MTASSRSQSAKGNCDNAASSSFMGMAKLMLVTVLPSSVSVIPLVFIPTTQPNASSSGPPLLPGFSVASVCSNASSLRLAEIMPRVTVMSCPSSEPKGNPIAITSSPTRISSESPNPIGVNRPPEYA